MIEELYAYALLLEAGLVKITEYGEYLDTHFLLEPDNSILLELEWCFSDTQKSISTIRNYCSDYSIDYDVFGQFLFSKLEETYLQNKLSLKDFSTKSYMIWQQFPDKVHQTEPFWTLCYADDPLSWGDEKQTRELYEKAFRYYDDS